MGWSLTSASFSTSVLYGRAPLYLLRANLRMNSPVQCAYLLRGAPSGKASRRVDHLRCRPSFSSSLLLSLLSIQSEHAGSHWKYLSHKGELGVLHAADSGVHDLRKWLTTGMEDSHLRNDSCRIRTRALWAHSVSPLHPVASRFSGLLQVCSLAHWSSRARCTFHPLPNTVGVPSP